MRKRTELRNRFHVPGPGTHKINNSLRNRTYPSYSMGARLRDRKGDKVPDCGTYDPWDSKRTALQKAPSYTFRKRFKPAEPSSLKAPGPGKYDLGTTIGRGTKLTMSK